MNPNSICMVGCPADYFKNEADNTCDACHALCAGCTADDEFSCTACIN